MRRPTREEVRKVTVAFGEFFRGATGRDPFPYQAALAERQRLPQLLRVPTGAGKTAAAVLAWLYRRRHHPDPTVRAATPRRLVYCLPLRSLVEQTEADVNNWLTRLGLGNEVGVHVLLGGHVDQDWARTPDRDAVLLGTMDMLLSRALNRGFAASRYRWPIEFALLNNDSLWVLDEVQLMGNGVSTSAQLQGLRDTLGVFRPTASLWMSATVEPAWIRGPDFRSLDAAGQTLELGADDRTTPALRERLEARKLLRHLPLDAREDWAIALARTVINHHRANTRTLVVLNTVERATNLYRAIKRLQPASDLVLLHSRFRLADRAAKIQRLLARPGEAGTIAVSTQVLEAGVDVSVATLFTELAPWASIVQRIGRCNRFGENADASVFWLDAPSSEPYRPDELERARTILADFEGSSAGPAALEHLPRADAPVPTHVLRRVDLLDLFDTEPDLSGNDVDVARYIRDDADVDCRVFWRDLGGAPPPPDTTRPSRDELCPVQPARLQPLLKRLPAQGAYRWDQLAHTWRRATVDDLRPGVVLMLDSAAGGYSAELGFDPSHASFVEPARQNGYAGAQPEEGFDSEEHSEADGAWVPLAKHAAETAAELGRMLDRLDLEQRGEPWVTRAVSVAALWHDVGKAHPVFQRALLAHLPEAQQKELAGTVWAKSSGGLNRYERPHFRHELASALAFLEAVRASPEIVRAPGEQWTLARDLVAYLVAAHHGKIRLAVRSLPGERHPEPAEEAEALRPFARGVWHGDAFPALKLDGIDVPPVRLDLSLMAVGLGEDGEHSWLERTLHLLEAFGPFRLAYLEALVRLADWTASEHSAGEESHVR
jgi:CRISPR-associated endonuclease/helicase Cas3